MKSRHVGLIVPQGTEFQFITEILQLTGEENRGGVHYHRFALPGTAVTGVVHVLFDMGEAPATLAADRLIGQLGVSLVVLIGTAGGLDSRVRLGDVVVANQIQEYLRNAKAVPGPGLVDFERAAESWRTNARLVRHVENFPWMVAGRPAMAAWRKSALGRWPGAAGEEREPAVHVGPIATGDMVVAANSFANWIRASNRKLVALDMEAGGAALAAYHNDSADLLVVRGVSDHADEHKGAWDAGQGASGRGDAWRHYAVRNAMEYLAALLASAGFPWRDIGDGESSSHTAVHTHGNRARVSDVALGAAAGTAVVELAMHHGHPRPTGPGNGQDTDDGRDQNSDQEEYQGDDVPQDDDDNRQESADEHPDDSVDGSDFENLS